MTQTSADRRRFLRELAASTAVLPVGVAARVSWLGEDVLPASVPKTAQPHGPAPFIFNVTNFGAVPGGKALRFPVSAEET